MSEPGEHSDRARYVTEQVSLWLQNDRKHFEEAARRINGFNAGSRDASNVLELYVTSVLRHARPRTAPWQVTRELAPNDYGRIRWADIVRDLSGG